MIGAETSWLRPLFHLSLLVELVFRSQHSNSSKTPLFYHRVASQLEPLSRSHSQSQPLVQLVTISIFHFITLALLFCPNLVLAKALAYSLLLLPLLARIQAFLWFTRQLRQTVSQRTQFLRVNSPPLHSTKSWSWHLSVIQSCKISPTWPRLLMCYLDPSP